MRHSPLVLVVDDDPDSRGAYREYLSLLGFRVEEAGTGDDAIAYARDRVPDVILMDLQLPGLDGWEVTRRLKGARKTRATKIIALSGCVYPSDIIEAERAGVDAFLKKPCAPTDVLDEIMRHTRAA